MRELACALAIVMCLAACGGGGGGGGSESTGETGSSALSGDPDREAGEEVDGAAAQTAPTDIGGQCQTRLSHSTGVPHSHGDGHGGCVPGTVSADGGGEDPRPPAGGPNTPPQPDQGGVCQNGRLEHTTGVPHSHGNGHGGCVPGNVTPDGGGEDPRPPTGGANPPAPDQGGVCQNGQLNHTTPVPHSHGNGHGGCVPGTVTPDGGGEDEPQPPTGDVTGVCQTRVAHTTPIPHSHGNGHGGCVPGEISPTGRAVTIQGPLRCSQSSLSIVEPEMDLVIEGDGEGTCIQATDSCTAELVARSITLVNCGECLTLRRGASVVLDAWQGDVYCDALVQTVEARESSTAAVSAAGRITLLQAYADGGPYAAVDESSLLVLEAPRGCSTEEDGREARLSAAPGTDLSGCGR